LPGQLLRQRQRVEDLEAFESHRSLVCGERGGGLGREMGQPIQRKIGDAEVGRGGMMGQRRSGFRRESLEAIEQEFPLAAGQHGRDFGGERL
jgi:hypothetical protein